MVLAAAGLFAGASSHQAPGTIVVDASQFYDRIPAGDGISEGRGGGNGRWVFNNAVLALGSKEDAVATVNIPEAGEYRLFVRSWGAAGSAFRISIQGQQSDVTFGDGKEGMVPGGTMNVKAGPAEFRLTGIQGRPVFNALVLTERTEFSDADLRPLELPDEVELLKDYKIPDASIVKFGDVDGD